MLEIIRRIRVQVGEIVEIEWRSFNNEKLTERITAPPKSTWDARLEVTNKEYET